MAEAFGGTNRVLLINPYIPARTELIGNTTKQASSKDVGKPVKLSGDAVVLATYGDPIYGFIESMEAGSKNGYSIGGVLCDRGCEAYATDEAGTLAVGDLVVAGTVIAFGTQTPAKGANVVKAQATGTANQVLNSGGLAIKAGGSAVVKTVNTVKALINGQYVSKAAGDMPALAGTVAAGTYNVWCFFMNAAGTLSAVFGTPGASAAAVEFPPVPADSVMLGFVLVTHSSDFVGGTTALDTGTAVYTDTPFPMGSANAAHQWQVMAKYTSGTYSGAVLLRKI